MSFRPHLLSLAALALALPLSAKADNPFKSPDTVYQLAPLEALLSGVYEGQTRLADLLAMGDLGMGTVNPLDGEMIILDGVAYRAALDGTLNVLPPETLIPFGQIKAFKVDKTAVLGPVATYEELCKALDAQLQTPNGIYAIRIDGKFNYLKTRSVPAQRAPFQPLSKILGTQQIREAENVEGTMVIYKFPAYLSRANVAGYHIHYVDKDRKVGGHVLEVRAEALTALIDEAQTLTLAVPQDPLFDTTDLSTGSGNVATQVLRGK
jgi:acetolactate decarboxylase